MSDTGSDRTRAVYDETILANPEIIDGTRINLHAERAQLERRDVRGQLAIITRRTVTVRKTIEVDVMHEELDVRYEPGDGTEIVGVEPKSFSILLRAEEVEIVKRVRVVEEAVISKRRVVESTRLDVALRHERLDVLDAKALQRSAAEATLSAAPRRIKDGLVESSPAFARLWQERHVIHPAEQGTVNLRQPDFGDAEYEAQTLM